MKKRSLLILIAAVAVLAAIFVGSAIPIPVQETERLDTILKPAAWERIDRLRFSGESSAAAWLRIFTEFSGQAAAEDAGANDPSIPPGSVFAQIGGGTGHNRCRIIDGAPRCVRVPGQGIDRCDNDAECATSHTECWCYQCITVYEPGVDRCGRDADCNGDPAVETHRACRNLGLGPQCAVVRGTGPDSCDNDVDCQ